MNKLSYFLNAVADAPLEMEIDEKQNGSKEAANIALSDMDYLKKKMTSENKVNKTEAKIEAKGGGEKKSRRKDPDIDKRENTTKSDRSNLAKKDDQPMENQNETGDVKVEDFERKTEFTIKLRGLPFHAKKKDIEEFLSPLKIIDIRMPKDSKNRPSGWAYIDLESEECVKMALKRHKDYIKGRYIEVFEDKRREIKKEEAENEPPWMENAKELAENKDLSIAEV